MTIYLKEKMSTKKRVDYRRIYEKYHGPIPKEVNGRTYEIHHIDGNRENNDISNLVALSIQEHYDIHYSQGDYAACLLIARAMTISPEEKSRLSKLSNKKLIKSGKHIFVKNNPVYTQLKNGTHPFADSKFATERNNKWVENGTHQFLTRSDGTSLQQDRVNDGTHNFIGGKSQQISVARNMKEGTHPSQLQWCCIQCRYHGKGASNYIRHINSKSHK